MIKASIEGFKPRPSIAEGRFSNESLDSDIIIKKKILKQVFYTDPAIIELLDNPELDPESPDEYVGENILSYIKINPTQDKAKNYLCFDIDDTGVSNDSKGVKYQVVKVVVLVHEKNMKTDLGMDRHDALGYLVIDNLNLSNILGQQLKLIQDYTDIIDAKYYSRTIKFQILAPNDIKNGGHGKYDQFVGT